MTHRHIAPKRHAGALPVVVLLIGVTLSVLGWAWLDHVEERLARTTFESDADERMLAIGEQFDESNAALEDLSSLYMIQDDVSGEQFAIFADPILARRPALRALSWNPVVDADDRAAHEAQARLEGRPDYQIVELDSQGNLVRAGDRDTYVVVGEIAPAEGNERAVGFDVASEQVRREALDAATDRGAVAVAMPIDLVQSTEVSTGALGFLPRYRPGAPTATVEQRRQSVEGFFVYVVDIADVVATALANLDDADIDVSILLESEGGTDELLYTSHEGETPAAIIDRVRAAQETRSGLVSIERFAVRDSALVVTIEAGPTYSDRFETIVPIVALFGGLVMAMLAAAYLRSLYQRASRIEREVADRTAALQEANRGLEIEVARRMEAERALESYRDDLERQVSERTAELEYTTTQLRAIVESEPECVKLLTHRGELVEMNPAGLRMIEAESLDAVRGLIVYDLIADADREAFVDLNERVMAGESGTLEFEIHGLQGTVRRVETHAVPLRTADGEPPLHLAVTRDVTDRQIAEQERAALEVQLRQSQKLESIGVMAGGIAHDFNNLLHVIVGNTELALDDAGADECLRDALEAARAAATEAARLCDQMLTYAGESRPDVHPVSLPRIVRSMADLLQVSMPKKVRLDLELEEGLGSIEGDATQLGQIVMNLVTNGAEAIGDRSGTVRVRVRALQVDAGGEIMPRLDERHAGPTGPEGLWFASRPAPGRYVCIEVCDSGAGMTAGEVELIFDPFYTTKFAGRGLGLSSTLGIVRSHAGHLHVSTAVGEGSAFTVLFPASAAPVVDPVDAVVDHDAGFRGTVLFVDDEAQIRSAGTSVLESLGLRVVCAPDGEAAVREFERRAAEIDIVMLDVTMPKLDGNETSAALRAIRPDLPIIFCSGYSADVADERMGHEGFTGFLHKPYRRRDLVAALRDADQAAGWMPALSV